MVVKSELQGDVCVLRLEGRFATGQDSEYLRAKAEELRSQGCRKIVADFTHVSYIDSTGIGFLISIYTSIQRNQDGRFVIAGPSPRVCEVLKLTRLDTILISYPDVQRALAAMREATA